MVCMGLVKTLGSRVLCRIKIKVDLVALGIFLLCWNPGFFGLWTQVWIQDVVGHFDQHDKFIVQIV
jgi:hypothetical protein